MSTNMAQNIQLEISAKYKLESISTFFSFLHFTEGERTTKQFRIKSSNRANKFYMSMVKPKHRLTNISVTANNETKGVILFRLTSILIYFCY